MDYADDVERSLERAYRLLEQCAAERGDRERDTPEPEPPPQPLGMPRENRWWAPAPEPPPRERSTKTERSPAMNGNELAALVRSVARDEVAHVVEKVEKLKVLLCNVIGETVVAERVRHEKLHDEIVARVDGLDERERLRNFYSSLSERVASLEARAGTAPDNDSGVLDLSDERRRRGNA